MPPIYHEIKAAYPNLSQFWDNSIIPELFKFIKIPNQSPAFDPEWEEHGFMQKAAELIKNWCANQPIRDMQISLLQDKGYTPLLIIDIPGQTDDTVLLYGHMDKQPPMNGWNPGFGPWEPVLKDGKLYGRGASDDGYAIYAAMTAILQLQQLNIPHARCVILIEASEESGSIDLPHYLDQLYTLIGSPSLIICLDSGCHNYQHLWNTTSLRGIINGELSIQVLEHSIHSGLGAGVVPSTFNVLRLLLERIEDPTTGKILLPELNAAIPAQQQNHVKCLAKALNTDDFIAAFPWSGATQSLTLDLEELILNQTWNPALSIIGIKGLPQIAKAGNVITPKLTVKLSFRLPPICNPKEAISALKIALEKEPPFQARIKFHAHEANKGWLAPPIKPWLEEANELASQLFFQNPAMNLGEGGSIPFMNMLGEKFPDAQFLITGVLGPQSNAHGPNEFLHIDMAKKITACISTVIAAHHSHLKL